MTQPPPALLVAGPTASGKSALALALARKLGGVVINADSMQVYRELRVLTARPSAADEAVVPHRLYGVRPAAMAADAAWWREAALAVMAEASAAGLLPILCGGTGLYLRALTEGLAAIPSVAPAIRAEARSLLSSLGAPALHARLAVLDPETAAGLRPSDSQRVARAWEVVRATGRGLRAWQHATPAGECAPWRFLAIRLDPPREALRAAIGARFDAMLDEGALAEVAALREQGLPSTLPAMRAHGVPELCAHLEGRMSLAAARDRAVLNTGQYTKRQATWFRHHPLTQEPDSLIFSARYGDQTQFSESILTEILLFVDQRG